jgi:nucleoside-diphosphate-sugar epimerase
MRYVITGGLGFFGSIMSEHLVQAGHDVLSVDWLADNDPHRKYRNARVDITNQTALYDCLKDFGQIDCIFHIAALLAHDKEHLSHLWASNVDGTANVMAVAQELNIAKVVFTSTNCVFSSGFAQAVDESQPTKPIEIYGKSKLAAEEKILARRDVNSTIIRCPTIIAAGRLGLLTILFDFVREGRRLYLVGDGSNRYSFIAAQDLVNACILAANSNKSGIYNVGSDNVPTMRQLYESLMKYAGKTSRLMSIPEGPTILALSILNKLGLSPLGPYHYRMLAANFVFDNSKIKRELGWQPTQTNVEILCSAYQYYIDHLSEIEAEQGKSAHKSKAKAGILNLLRLLS